MKRLYLWNYVKGAYCAKLSVIKLNLNSNCEDSVIFMQIVENILQYLLATHLRQGSLWLQTLLCMIWFCMWGILFPKHTPIYKVSVAALALIRVQVAQEINLRKLFLRVQPGWSKVQLQLSFLKLIYTSFSVSLFCFMKNYWGRKISKAEKL